MIANSASRSVVGYRRSCRTRSAGTKKAMPTSAMRPGVHRAGALVGGLGERAHRRIERTGRRPGEGDHVGQVEDVDGDADEVDLGEHVQGVADEHREQSGDEEAVRRAPLAARAEGDLQRHDEQEERGRRIADEDQFQVHRRALASQHGLDHVHERAGEHGERGDDAVVDDAEAVALSTRCGPG